MRLLTTAAFALFLSASFANSETECGATMSVDQTVDALRKAAQGDNWHKIDCALQSAEKLPRNYQWIGPLARLYVASQNPETDNPKFRDLYTRRYYQLMGNYLVEGGDPERYQMYLYFLQFYVHPFRSDIPIPPEKLQELTCFVLHDQVTIPVKQAKQSNEYRACVET